jgi:hypothetical protein
VSTVDELSQKWMAYIDAEVRAACRQKGLGCQVRRKWSVRATPVSASAVDDYEWKLIPGADGSLPEQTPREFDEGSYYVLGLDRQSGTFIFQHDTRHAGADPEFNVRSFTEIELLALDNPDYIRLWRETGGTAQAARVATPPPVGWLCNILVRLTERFQPNWFSLT